MLKNSIRTSLLLRLGRRVCDLLADRADLHVVALDLEPPPSRGCVEGRRLDLRGGGLAEAGRQHLEDALDDLVLLLEQLVEVGGMPRERREQFERLSHAEPTGQGGVLELRLRCLSSARCKHIFR